MKKEINKQYKIKVLINVWVKKDFIDINLVK